MPLITSGNMPFHSNYITLPPPKSVHLLLPFTKNLNFFAQYKKKKESYNENHSLLLETNLYLHLFVVYPLFTLGRGRE